MTQQGAIVMAKANQQIISVKDHVQEILEVNRAYSFTSIENLSMIIGCTLRFNIPKIYGYG